MIASADRVPVIAGVGEIADRPEDPVQGKEPAALMADALRLADADAGGGFLCARFADIVNEISFPYLDPAGRVWRAGAREAASTRRDGVVGGQTPILFLHEAALRIARGERRRGYLRGRTSYVRRAAKAGLRLPWPGRSTGPSTYPWRALSEASRQTLECCNADQRLSFL